MAVFRLDESLWFPDPHMGEENGLVAVGGDLSPRRLKEAYSKGFFPWFSFFDCAEPVWYCPLQRFVIFPGEIHVSHSLRTMINGNKYYCTFNEDFKRVIVGCAMADDRCYMEGAWLGPDMMEAYTRMHTLGVAKSVEVWARNENGPSMLVGGLYGMQVGRGFMGESMFSLSPGASKLALVFLARKALEEGWNFIDCQFETPHLRSMGGRHISYEEYLSLL